MRYALVYGVISGTISMGVLIAGIIFAPHSFMQTVWFGYLTMIVAMTFMFVGMKRYRDLEKGGVIRFLPALGLGLAIAIVAVIAYVLIWEIYLAATHYAFIDKVFRGTDPAIVAAREAYRNPLYRVLETGKELAPVGLIMALFSAALLRNPKLLPARRPAR
jgi:hypothetical protein